MKVSFKINGREYRFFKQFFWIYRLKIVKASMHAGCPSCVELSRFPLRILGLKLQKTFSHLLKQKHVNDIGILHNWVGSWHLTSYLLYILIAIWFKRQNKIGKGARNMHTQNFKILRSSRAKKTKICTFCW